MAKILRPAGTVLCPVPVVMVSCGVPGGRPNIITLAWAGTVCSEPPMVGLAIRPSRYSFEILRAHGDLVVNIPNRSLLQAADYCGVASGRDVDKFAVQGLTPAPATQVSAPLIAECPINIEARVGQVIPLGSHHLFLAQVLAVHLNEEILNSRGRIDPAKLDAVAYGPGEYWGANRFLAAHGFSHVPADRR